MHTRKSWVATLLLTSSLFINAAKADSPLFPQDGCEDGSCPIPTVNENNQPVYAIVSPVGYRAVEPITQVPRLDSLDGKKIALVGGSFMASVTHGELKQCILEAYPTAQVFMFQEVGAAGPYSVFGQSAQTAAFQNRLKELGIDAVVAGNCGCGLCTTKETGSAIAAEYVGVPAVAVGAPTFIAQIHSTGVNRGVPVIRTAEYPGAFASHSEEELRRHTRETVWPQIVSALTEPIAQEEARRYAENVKRPFDEAVYTGTFDEVQDFCKVNGWTDGLRVTVGVVNRQNRLEGRATPDGASLTVSVRMTDFAVALGGVPTLDRDSARNFLALNGSQAAVNPRAQEGSAAKIGVQKTDGSWRTLTFTKIDRRRINVVYRAQDTLNR